MHRIFIGIAVIWMSMGTGSGTVLQALAEEQGTPPSIRSQHLEAMGQLSQDMSQAGYTAEHRLSIENTLRAGMDRGVPAEVLADKVHEGIAKRVGPERVTMALERVIDRFAFAETLAEELSLDRHQAKVMTQAIAEGLSAGLAENDAAAIAAQVRSELGATSRKEQAVVAQEAFLTARDWARHRVTSRTATEVIGLALQRKLGVDGLRALRTAMARNKGEISGDVFAGRVGNALRNGAGPAAIAGIDSNNGQRSGSKRSAGQAGGSVGGSGGAGAGAGSDSGGSGGSGNSGGPGVSDGSDGSDGSGAGGGGSGSGGGGGDGGSGSGGGGGNGR